MTRSYEAVVAEIERFGYKVDSRGLLQSLLGDLSFRPRKREVVRLTLRALARELDGDETIVDAVAGHRPRTGPPLERLLVVTGRRLLALDLEALSHISWAHVTHLTISAGVDGRRIKIEGAPGHGSVDFTIELDPNDHQWSEGRFASVEREIRGRVRKVANRGLDPDGADLTAVNGGSIVGELERLAKLRQDGLLSEDEFREAKRHLLSHMTNG